MTTDTDFLTQIVRDPFDTSLRLIYADWLEEHQGAIVCPECNQRGWLDTPTRMPYDCNFCHGQGVISSTNGAKAEFIRVQCELADTPQRQNCGLLKGSRDCGCDWCLLRRRERELLESNWTDWFDVQALFQRSSYGVASGNTILLGNTHDAPDVECVVSLGFVGKVSLPLDAWLGGECENCRDLRMGDKWCGICSGTGHIPGLGNQLVLAAPITAVHFTAPFRWTDCPRAWLQKAGLHLGDSWRAFIETDMGDDAISHIAINEAREAEGLPLLWAS